MLPPRFQQADSSSAGGTGLLTGLLPDYVAVAEQLGVFAGNLLPEEQAALGGAVAKRQMEFAAGRRCAREALQKLGVPACPILRGSSREPLWPEGVVGSITHCEGYCGAAASFVERVASLGIDAEPDQPLPEGVLTMIARIEEIGHLHRHPAAARCNPDRLLFSAKESTYKAWYPLARCWLAFDAVRIQFQDDGASFEVVFVMPLPGALAGLRFHGRYLIRKGLILTSVVAEAGTGEAWRSN